MQSADGSTLGDFTIAGGRRDRLDTDAHDVDGAESQRHLKGASISKMLDTLRRTDGTSWLDSGFFEGQLVQITRPAAAARCSRRST